AFGGCIATSGSVTLRSSIISSCEVYSYSGTAALGGGIWASMDVRLYDSRLLANIAYDFNHTADGGGAFVNGELYLRNSTISANTAHGGEQGIGGGAYVVGAAALIYSTVDSNIAQTAAGIKVNGFCGYACSALVYTSTISGNRASGDFGGLSAQPYLL